MSFIRKQKLAVLCDFDGTITPGDILDILYTKFAGPECQELARKWVKGEISTPAEIQGCFASMRASQAEMESALDPVRIDPSFAGFVRFCREQSYTFAILSDGLSWYIRYILQRYGVEDLTIYANEVEFGQDGMLIHSPWYHPNTPLRGTSKPAIVLKYQAEGYTVVFLGDGPTDVEAVEVADIVFAKGRLAQYCRTQSLPFTEFNTFSDVIQHWETRVALK